MTDRLSERHFGTAAFWFDEVAEHEEMDLDWAKIAAWALLLAACLAFWARAARRARR